MTTRIPAAQLREWEVRLSWPAQPLWQNRRVSWRKRAESVRIARTEAWAVAKKAKLPRLPTAILTFAFYPPDNRRRDIQNMPATMKAAIDGIADAMGCDDTGFRCVFPTTFSHIAPGGGVVIQIREV